jgi:pSer/pThr/pTyr-binding forkhead associated (FHA) protein
MAKLSVKRHGEEVAQLELESGREYFAGRSQEADIRLEAQRGISRQHLKFYERDGVWVCESLSKFVQIQRGSDSVDVLELTEACAFTVSSYEFHFEPELAVAAEAVAVVPAENAETGGHQPLRNPPALTGDHSLPRANNEATMAGGATLIPYFRISFPNTTDDEVLKLEGQLWTAGRDSDCEIHIDSPHVSRRHFELARSNNGYFITDLGSSNGTRVNGQRIAAHEPTQLMSGDEIGVQNIVMTFEIRDSQFANKLERLPQVGFDPLAMGGPLAPEDWQMGALPAAYDATQYQSYERKPKEETLTGFSALKRKISKMNKVRLALYVLVPLVLIMALLPDKKTEEQPKPGTEKQSLTFENLPKEKKMVVKDSFNLASSLYTSGKYALCLTELAKLHEIVPQYANSKELQSYCEQGLELTRREQDAERQRREREKIESQVQGYVDQCKSTLKADASVEETRLCLVHAIELAPDHNLVVEMLHSAQIHEEEKKFMQAEKVKEEAREARGVAHYNHAMEIYKKGQLHKSVGELEKFVSGDYPHVAELKEKARRNIASIKAELKVKVVSQLEQCKQLGSKNAWRDAYKACALAVTEDPENTEAKELRGHMLSELRREMKGIYEDSVLEESMGNVDTAKEKWKKIMADDLPDDDYTTKARSKLQKYGLGD